MERDQLFEILRNTFVEDELEQIAEFLDQDGGFARDAELIVLSILFHAKKCDVPTDKILWALGQEWSRTWAQQTSETRGSYGAPGMFWAQNATSASYVCHLLNIDHHPNNDSSRFNGNFSVITINRKTYLFDRIGKFEKRSVSKKTPDNPVVERIGDCRILFIVPKKPMFFILCGKDGSLEIVETSTVDSIEFGL